MKDHLFVWIDEDMEYVGGVMAFVQQSSYKDLIDLKVFTTASNAESFLTRTSKIPLIIGMEQVIQAMTLSNSGYASVVLHTQAIETKNHKDTYPYHLHKYQALTRLFAELCQIDLAHKQALGLVDERKARRTKVIGVCSAIGHCGKSTVALNIARSLSMKQYRVLYVSLESIGSAEIVLQADADHHSSSELLSQLMYLLKIDRSRFTSKLPSVIKRDPVIGIDYISTINQVREMEEMSKSEVKHFLDGAIQNDQYDWLVIDMESSAHPRIVTALEYCDDVVWLIQDDAICLHKTNLIVRAMPALNRLHYVVNKYTGRLAIDAGTYECEPSFFLPYIPEWKNNANPNVLITHRIYQEAISFLIRALEKQVPPKGRLG